MDGSTTAFEKYIGLVAKVDSFLRTVGSAHQGEMECGPGCSDCCGSAFTVFAVEVHNLRLGYDALDPAEKRTVKENSRMSHPNSPCPLLKAGLCLLYPYRPIICRTHGFPFTSENLRVRGQKVVSFCEKNFPGMPDLSCLPDEHVLNLDVLNSTLAAINCLYMKEAGSPDGHPDRLWPGDLFKAY